MDRIAGVRELKSRLSHYLDVARDEGPVIITDRGRPVARLTALPETRARKSIVLVLDELAADGSLDISSERPRRLPAAVTVRENVSASAVVRQLRR
jgi:prevent-host-death family protein